jgi:LuxR family transcriptional regulator, maltose regulon positive regulatory protein
MTGVVTRQRGEHGPQLISRDVSGARQLLDRNDLLLQLDRAVTKRVTVISAPPGSGKTSLLRAWADRSMSPGRVAFVTVERDQQSDQRFWYAVLEATRNPVRSTDSEVAPATTAAPEVGQLIDSVRSEVADRVEPIVLIIDDLHELKSADALSQLEDFLARLPSSARVVLSSRRDPSIRLHQLRLADEIAEIRAGDLRFTERETRELFARSAIRLSDDAVAALYQRTEGWAAGLRLAVISLSGHPDPERFVAEFSGTDRAIGEYLMAEMLERQPSEVQSMLMRTSLVDRMNGELADLLAGRSGSEQILLALEEANAFVVSLDAQRTWFRYHHLLADFLRLELRRTLADEVPDLHRRAAQWFADRGDVVEAVRHKVAAGDWPDAARLVADHSFRWVLDGQAGTIRAVLQTFPAGASVDHPDLALAHAAAELNQGRTEDAATQLALAESHVQSAPPARRRRLEVATASLRLALARRSGQFDDVMEQVRLLDASIGDASREPNGLDTELRAVALLNLGIVETWSGRFADAERHVTEGAMLAQAIGRPYVEVACRAYQAFPSTGVSLANARERGRHAFAMAGRYGLTDHPVLAPAFGAVACMAVWMGEFDEGERWLRRGWDVIQANVDPAAAVLLHMVTGMLQVGRGEHESGLKALTAAVHAQALLSGVHILSTVVAEWLAATQARLGMPDEARTTLAGFSTEHQRMDGFALTGALISLAEGDPATALAVLGDVRGMMPPAGFPAYALVEGHVLAGLAHLALGDRSAAATAAEAALAAAEPDRLIFPFAMFDAAELLEVLPRHQTAHGALLADVVDLLRGTAAPRTYEDRHAKQSPELSPGELRVLRYLPTNLTRPEIAQQLRVSVNTVGTHIRNVYTKLGVSDRSGAVDRARQLRLVSNRISPTSPK